MRKIIELRTVRFFIAAVTGIVLSVGAASVAHADGTDTGTSTSTTGTGTSTPGGGVIIDDSQPWT
jgi:hypothetical protein